MKRFAFDIGGTNMRMAELTDAGIGPVARLPTPKEPDEAIERLTELARAAAQEGGIEKVAIAFAGVVDENGAIEFSTNLPLWAGCALARKFTEALGAPTDVVNDAELAALGEARYGAGKEFTDVAYLTVGTGVGTAHVKNGIVETHSSDGEARDTIIALSRGKTLETEIGGRALAEKYGASAEQLPRDTWEKLTPLLARGVIQAARLWKPEIIVLGGALMNETDGFRIADIEKETNALAKTGETVPLLRRATFEDASALHGARALID